MTFTVTVLGSNAAIPAYGRYPSAQILNHNGRLFLIDCGEGTQMQFNRYGIKRGRLHHIFISHLHGDHFFGLPGLLSSSHLLGRQAPLHLYGPSALDEILNVLLGHIRINLNFPLHFHPLDPEQHTVIIEDDELEVKTLPLRHSIPCAGFLFREKPRGRKMIASQLEARDIPFDAIPTLRKGKDYRTPAGKIIPNAELTTAPPPPRAYAYCSDTAYSDTLPALVKGVDLLYHEATFDREEADRAARTLHATTVDAARIARQAKAKALLIGHFSAKYRTLDKLLKEAREGFTDTYLAEEGKTFPVGPQEQPAENDA